MTPHHLHRRCERTTHFPPALPHLPSSFIVDRYYLLGIASTAGSGHSLPGLVDVGGVARKIQGDIILFFRLI